MSPAQQNGTNGTSQSLQFDQRLSGDLEELSEFARELAQLDTRGPNRLQGGDLDTPRTTTRINADQDTVDHDLARLVLTVIDLVRRLMEKQAIRRIEAGTLTDEQIERMGETFIKLDEKMEEMKEIFGLDDDDLHLNLGPLRDLL